MMDEILKITKKILSGQPISGDQWALLTDAANKFLEEEATTGSQKKALNTMLKLLDAKKQIT